jgi:hypothetical protein
VSVDVGAGWADAPGVGSGFAAAEFVAGAAVLFVVAFDCVSVAGAVTMTVGGRRNAINASTPPPTTSASTSAAAVAR